MIQLVVLVTVVVSVALAVRRNQRARATTVAVTADERGVHRTLADGRREEVAWDEVVQVDLFTTRVGPHKASGGAVVLFGTETRGCIVPLDRLADSGLLEHVHHLPGFDARALVAAASLEADDTSVRAALSPRPLQRTTVCWTRADGATGE
jgi:hypothetical protein